MSGGITHTLFYVVVVASGTPNLDFTASKDEFRRRVLAENIPFIVNFAQVYPAVQANPIKAFALVDDNFAAPANQTPSSEVAVSLATLYKSALGSDLLQVTCNWSIDEPFFSCWSWPNLKSILN